jgi:hypothetical protein
MLSSNDNAVLTQIFDPESAPSASVLVDSSLPEDPNIQDDNTLTEIRQREKSIILNVEASIKQRNPTAKTQSLNEAAKAMEDLILEYPNSASSLNNYAQIIRLLHGNALLSPAQSALATKVYTRLSKAISLLTPPLPQAAISPAQCKTLAQAHTQRGALLYGFAKALTRSSNAEQLLESISILKGYTVVDLEEAASRDFFMGGRYGNEVGKALAVHTNPTAKLCGQMVQSAMRREFAPLEDTSVAL